MVKSTLHTFYFYVDNFLCISLEKSTKVTTVWYGIVEFNVPLDTVQVISEMGALSSDVHLPFSNGGPAT